jgi:hypothetical protein
MSPGNISGHTQRGGGWKYIPTGKVMDHGARQSIDPCSLDACFHLNVLLQQGHALTTSAESMGMNLPVGVGSYFSNSVREGCVSTAAWKHDYKWAQEIIDCGHLVRCSDSEVPVGAVNNLMLKPARRSSVARETGNVTYTETAHSDCWYKQVWVVKSTSGFLVEDHTMEVTANHQHPIDLLSFVFSSCQVLLNQTILVKVVTFADCNLLAGNSDIKLTLSSALQTIAMELSNLNFDLSLKTSNDAGHGNGVTFNCDSFRQCLKSVSPHGKICYVNIDN